MFPFAANDLVALLALQCLHDDGLVLGLGVAMAELFPFFFFFLLFWLVWLVFSKWKIRENREALENARGKREEALRGVAEARSERLKSRPLAAS